MNENKISLYDISEKFLELFNRDDLTKEEEEEQGNELAFMLQNKAEQIVGYNFTLEANKSALKQEIERLTHAYNVIDKQQEKLNNYVKVNMEKLNLTEIVTPIGKLKIQRNPISVDIYDNSKIDNKYIITKISKNISKTKIKEDLEKGIEVEGARLIQNTKLNIK